MTTPASQTPQESPDGIDIQPNIVFNEWQRHLRMMGLTKKTKKLMRGNGKRATAARQLFGAAVLFGKYSFDAGFKLAGILAGSLPSSECPASEPDSQPAVVEPVMARKGILRAAMNAPEKPTKAMLLAGRAALPDYPAEYCLTFEQLKTVYAAMMAARLAS